MKLLVSIAALVFATSMTVNADQGCSVKVPNAEDLNVDMQLDPAAGAPQGWRALKAQVGSMEVRAIFNSEDAEMASITVNENGKRIAAAIGTNLLVYNDGNMNLVITCGK